MRKTEVVKNIYSPTQKASKQLNISSTDQPDLIRGSKTRLFLLIVPQLPLFSPSSFFSSAGKQMLRLGPTRKTRHSLPPPTQATEGRRGRGGGDHCYRNPILSTKGGAQTPPPKERRKKKRDTAHKRKEGKCGKKIDWGFFSSPSLYLPRWVNK